MKLNSMQNKIVEVTYRIAGDEINEQLSKMMALRIKAFTKSVLHDSIYLGTWTTVRVLRGRIMVAIADEIKIQRNLPLTYDH